MVKGLRQEMEEVTAEVMRLERRGEGSLVVNREKFELGID